ncbi:MAG: uroporphyrinogen-III synthase [Proteobacteria bacterium]|nr:uroporphyrinogen-III synthase [Pseudomonadota bacterium]
MGYGERMRVLITRPEREATTLSQALGRRGHVPVIAPLFQLHFRRPPEDFAAALAASQAILLTSANGARALAEATELRSKPILAVGDMTAATAEGLGFTSVTSASGDSAALAQLVRERLDPKGGPLLHVSGADVKGDLGPQDFVRRFALYEARQVETLPDSARAALEARALDVATFFSPRAAKAFVQLVVAAGLAEACRPITAVAISPAATAPLEALPFKATIAAARPTRQAVLDEIDRLAEAGVQEAELARPIMSEPSPSSSPSQSEAPPPAATAAPQVALARRGIGAFGAFVVGIVAAVIVLAAALLSLPYWPEEVRAMWRGPASTAAGGGQVAEATAALKARLESEMRSRTEAETRATSVQAELRARLDDLDKRIRAIANTTAQAQAPAVPDEVLNGLRGRIEALENKPAPVPAPAPAPPPTATADVEKIDRDMAALRIEIATLRSGLQGLEQAMSGQKDQAATLADAVEKTKVQYSRISADEQKALAAARASALIGIAARLNAALDSEQPFAADLALLTPLAQDDKKIAEQSAALQPLAAKGVASRAALAAEFPAMAKAALAQDLADDSLGQRVLGRLKSAISLRRVGPDVPGDTVEAKLARAEAALKAGDLPKAVDLVKSLPSQTASAAAPWLARAEAHLTAQRAVDQLAAEGVALLGAAR